MYFVSFLLMKELAQVIPSAWTHLLLTGRTHSIDIDKSHKRVRVRSMLPLRCCVFKILELFIAMVPLRYVKKLIFEFRLETLYREVSMRLFYCEILRTLPCPYLKR